MLQNMLDLVASPWVWVTAVFCVVFMIGMGAGWLASNWSAAKDADEGRGFIYWRMKRYRVIPDDDERLEREYRHKHGTMAEQEWP